MLGGSGVVSMSVNRRINVLHFASTPVRAGAEEHMLTLLRRLDRARFRPMLVAPSALIDMLRPDLPAEVEMLPVTLTSTRNLGGALRLIGLLRKKAVDIV